MPSQNIFLILSYLIYYLICYLITSYLILSDPTTLLFDSVVKRKTHIQMNLSLLQLRHVMEEVIKPYILSIRTNLGLARLESECCFVFI